MPLAHSFDQYFAWVDCRDFVLPYYFGGATQWGRLAEHANNQDAMALWSREKCVVTVIADGCSTSTRGFSNTEVGSRLLSTLIVDIVGEASLAVGVAALSERLAVLEAQICERVLQMASAILPESHREDLLHNLFMTTILGFAVDATAYAVFGCGDGLFSINGKVVNLDQHSGKYLAGRLLPGSEWQKRLEAGDGMLQIYKTGPVDDLQYILLATDGFEDIYDKFPIFVDQFLQEESRGYQGKGYAPWIAADFRGRFWHLKEVQDWACLEDSHDDRSFVLLRRITQESLPRVDAGKEAVSSCSTSVKQTAIDVADSCPH